jgi:hypothetical protein
VLGSLGQSGTLCFGRESLAGGLLDFRVGRFGADVAKALEVRARLRSGTLGTQGFAARGADHQALGAEVRLAIEALATTRAILTAGRAHIVQTRGALDLITVLPGHTRVARKWHMVLGLVVAVHDTLASVLARAARLFAAPFACSERGRKVVVGWERTMTAAAWDR